MLGLTCRNGIHTIFLILHVDIFFDFTDTHNQTLWYLKPFPSFRPCFALVPSASFICSATFLTFPDASSPANSLLLPGSDLFLYTTLLCSVYKALTHRCVYRNVCTQDYCRFSCGISGEKRGQKVWWSPTVFAKHCLHTHTDNSPAQNTHVLCWCATTSQTALPVLRDCCLCFRTAEGSALSSTSPAFFHPTSPSLSLSIFCPPPPNIIQLCLPFFLTFTSISPSFSPASFCSFIPTSETVVTAPIGCSSRIRETGSQ